MKQSFFDIDTMSALMANMPVNSMSRAAMTEALTNTENFIINLSNLDPDLTGSYLWNRATPDARRKMIRHINKFILTDETKNTLKDVRLWDEMVLRARNFVSHLFDGGGMGLREFQWWFANDFANDSDDKKNFRKAVIIMIIARNEIGDDIHPEWERVDEFDGFNEKIWETAFCQ